jgi:hypothetical protein
MTIINKGIFDTADVFLRQTGNDWPTAQVLSTSDITEGSNLYFTNARVYAAITGNLVLKANVSDLTTANVSELTNLYYTNARVLSYITPILTTSNVAEGSNLYYTNARVYANITAALAGNVTVGNLVVNASTANSYTTTGNINAGNVIATSIVIGTSTANSYTTAGNVNAGNVIATSITIGVSTANSYTTTGNVTAGNVIATKIQGNTWVGLYTANVIESATALYYTNARVYSNVIALLPTLAGSGITIQANGQISASTATVSLAGLTTSNLAEGTNLYYTNTRAVSAFTEGSGIAISSGGVISARGDSAGSGLFNSGIQLVGNTLAQSTFSNVKVFSFAEGNTFIGYSFHVTNITSNIVYLTGRHVFDSNTTLFANLLEMPVGASMEVFRKPQVFRANDIIQIQGFDQNRTAVNNGISSYLSYQATVDDTYQRAGNTITGSALTTIYQTVGRVSIFESINLVNLSPNVIYGTVIVTDGSDNLVAYLAANLAIPAYASVDVCEYPKTLLDDYKIKVQKSDNYNPLSVFTSSKYTQSFAVTPSSNNMTESGTITLDLVTTNIVNGTVLYYSVSGVSGNINQTDFVTNITGTVIVQNNAARLTLQANADLNTNFEGDETFTVVYRKNSNVGTVVATSSSILLRDTSNVTVYSLTSNATSVLESTDVLFTLSTVNLPPNTTYYWNTSGNATSSNFVTSNTGSFVSNANTSYNILLAANAMAAGTSTDFQLRILTGSQTGTVVATSNVITIVDSSLAYMSATGGTIVDSGGYRTHIFTSTANLTISRIGASPAFNTIDYVVVAGGGGGGGGSYATGSYAGGGGGGAGGALSSNTLVTAAGNSVIVVGAGGAGLKFGPSGNGGSGSPTTLTLSGSPTLTAIGGGGGSGTTAGLTGGSGGGSALYLTSGGTGTPGQGYSGGVSAPTTEGSVPNSYMGGGGGGAGEAGHWNPADPVGVIATSTLAGGNGIPVSWAPVDYGTTGPAPGRWFAGGGGGGGSPAGVARILSGGAGGGGAGGNYGPGPATSARSLGTLSTPGALESGANAIINTGGGGGGVGQAGLASGPPGTSGQGGSGIVLIRYPYVPNLPNVNVLVVAGGGGGGSTNTNEGGAGGGGAGGYRYSNSFAIANTYTVYTVTVGAGGAGRPNSPSTGGIGTVGNPSSFNTITSAGGGAGGGGFGTGIGQDGGSGGGGKYGAGGAGNIPATSPSQGNPGGTGSPADPNYSGGGGGGAGAAGGSTPGPVAGGAPGGYGQYSSISGSNVAYAGGGGGAAFSGIGGIGGIGGGGDGGRNSQSEPGVNGTAYRGGGGGGGFGGGTGGSGVVIISYPTAYANATVLGSNVITTAANGNIIHSFYASGNIMFTG